MNEAVKKAVIQGSGSSRGPRITQPEPRTTSNEEPMTLRPSCRIRYPLTVALLFAFAIHANAQASSARKIFMITDMEGVSGIFDTELQCLPYKSVRWDESRKLLTGEINAAVDGLFEGGATEVVVWDGHASGQNLSVSEIHPRVRLLTGGAVSS